MVSLARSRNKEDSWITLEMTSSVEDEDTEDGDSEVLMVTTLATGTLVFWIGIVVDVILLAVKVRMRKIIAKRDYI